MLVNRSSLAGIFAVAALALAACSNPNVPQAQNTGTTTIEQMVAVQAPTGTPAVEFEWADGPTAADDRPIAPIEWAKDDKIIMAHLDLGNVSVGDFSLPVRGTLASSNNQSGPKPLIIVSHLRAPGCTGENYAYPCPGGTEEIRYDRGMNYLAADLAAQGYTVLIPDLAPAFIGVDATTPYSQAEAWTKVVQTLLEADSAASYLPQIDTDQVGLLVHSRSAGLITAANELLGDKLKGVMAFGSYFTTETADEFAQPLPDVPYLALTGELDSDVKSAGNRYLTRYLGQERTTPAYEGRVEGLGHMYINRAMSVAGMDDRIGCDVLDCPDAATHEQALTETALGWFGQIMPTAATQARTKSSNDASTLVTESSATPPILFPEQVTGLDVRWLAATPGFSVTRLAATDLEATGGQVCVLAENVVATAAEACTEPDIGVAESTVPVLAFTETSISGTWPAADGLALHILPHGTPPTEQGITVTLTTDRGDHTTTISGTHPALKSHQDAYTDGIYMPSTVRLALPQEMRGATLTGITLQGEDTTFALAGVDIW
ncbi:hypothetical protein [Rothia nasimurium]|uniref:hypothetical protein n=1 Tax=Rothia nasimurium TaxID=85336 RepID=UPI001F43E6EB|nr:hypothetical protein [Rothia nasimurium]